jgi:hypothetical protein
MVKTQRLFWLWILFLGLWPQLATAAQVRGVVDRDQVAPGESLHLELRVSGSPDGDPDLTPLERNWEILSRSQSSQIQIINGDFSRSVVYSLVLMPRREGELNIPAVCFGSDCSTPLPIRVTAADQAPAGSSRAELLLETEVQPEQVYRQQQLLFTVRLLRRVDLLQGSLSEPQPGGVDAVVQKIGDDRRFETRRDGRLYQVIERSYAIFPQASGTLEIPPLRFDGEIGRGANRFDPFGSRAERIRKRTETVRIEVLPPPADAGHRRWLPAQSLSLSDDWQGQTRQLTVGEPATRTLNLSALGLPAAQMPELRFSIPAEFKSYPDQPSRKDEVGAAGITGVLQQKIALVPTRPGRYQLPAIDLDWWDVNAKEWRTARLEPVSMVVSPAVDSAAAAPPLAAPTIPAPPAAEAPAAAAAPLPPAPPSVQPGFWPWLSLALGFGWLATLLLVWRQRRGRSGAVNESKQDSSPQKETSARQAALRAAGNDDAGATRQALAAWCQTLWPDANAGLERLGQGSPGLKRELDRLNRALYSPQGEAWTGRNLSDAIRQWDHMRRKRPPDDRLPGLYPTSTKDEEAARSGTEK